MRDYNSDSIYVRTDYTYQQVKMFQRAHYKQSRSPALPVLRALFAIALTTICLCGCNRQPQEEYTEFEVSENMELGCIELTAMDTVYRPYGVITNNSFKGGQVGTRNDNPDVKICQVREYSTAEWIVEYSEVFMDGGLMLYKAVGVVDIPEELSKFNQYDY